MFRTDWTACMQVWIVNILIQHSSNKLFELLCLYGVYKQDDDNSVGKFHKGFWVMIINLGIDVLMDTV